MGISISQFKGAVADLARPNRFLVNVSSPTETFTSKMQYLATAAVLPGREIGDVTINWQGMQVKFAGDPQVQDITVKFHNDYEFDVRNFFEKWLDVMALQSTNNRSDHAQYKALVTLDQIGRTEESIATYILEGAYPKSISAITLDMGQENGIEEFDVVFRYDTFYREDDSGVNPKT